MKKVKVFNKNKYDVGIKLSDGLREYNIKPGSFAIIDEDEAYYLNSICRIFSDKILICEDKEVNENMGFITEQPHVMSDVEIAEVLKGNALSLRKKLEAIKEPHLRYRIAEVAKTLDLNTSKIKLIKEITGIEIDLEDIK